MMEQCKSKHEEELPVDQKILFCFNHLHKNNSNQFDSLVYFSIKDRTNRAY